MHPHRSTHSFSHIQEPSLTQPSATPSTETGTVRVMYYVQAAADPNLLPRLIQPFAKLGLIPDRVYADREWHGDKDLNIELRLLSIDANQAILLEKTLASVIGVHNVIAVID